jgi:hypothetical protein
VIRLIAFDFKHISTIALGRTRSLAVPEEPIFQVGFWLIFRLEPVEGRFALASACRGMQGAEASASLMRSH